MPRFYLIFFLVLSCQFWSQKELQRIVAHADSQVIVLDYIEALKYYNRAIELEPNSIELFWKIAQTNAQFKDYKTAANFYLKVYEKDPDGLLFPTAQLQYALMLKQQSLYKEALAQFKEVKKFFAEEKSSYPFLKAQQEIVACTWVLKQLKYMSPEERAELSKHKVNTIDAEFGHLIFNDKLIYSSLKADSIGDDQEQILSKTYRLDLYEYPQSTPINDKLLIGQNTLYEYGNFCISPDTSFALCSECQRTASGYNCHLIRAKPSNGNWILDSLFNPQGNERIYASMPHIFISEEKLKLVYCSQQTSGVGGTDLWLATLDQNGNLLEQTNLITLNTTENEVSPWYDPLFKRLYFSSTWHAGFGGFDIFYSNLQENGQFGPPINIGMPFNSPANDLYFFCEGDTAYLSSNRIGSLYASHPTCCSDVFFQEFYRPKKKITSQLTDSTEISTTQTVKLPIRLYFENDHPNPKTTADFTDQTYDETYFKYKSQYPLYLEKVAEGRDQNAAIEQTVALNTFFENEVDKGMNDLALFREQVWEALQSGNQVSIMVQGFASPLAKSDYNVHLTSRRISSIINYFEEVDGGKFAPYMQTTPVRLKFVEVPMGEFQAKKDVSDNYYDQRNSVYSKDASLERRIEIIELRSEPLSPK